jgi:predicted transcriptional regulator
MPTPPPITLELDQETNHRLQRFATARGQSPDTILRDALTQYLDREEKSGVKNHPPRNPVGGIITPV